MRKKILLLLFLSSPLFARDIILWDIHKVLLTRSLPQTMQALISKKMAQSIMLLNWDFLKKVADTGIHNIFQETSAEKYIHLAQQYGNKPLAHLIIDVANAQHLTPGIVPIVKELDQLGFDQHVGSNIGQTAFEHLINPALYPEFKELFSYINTGKSRVVLFDENYIVRKPDPLFYTQYLEKNNLDPTKTRIIFIDDKKENIDSAKQLGLEGIHFKDTNQLRTELRKLGVQVAPAPQGQTRFEAYRELFNQPSR